MRYGMPRWMRQRARVGRPRLPPTGMTWTTMRLLASWMTMTAEICYELHLMWEYWLLI